MTYVIDQFEKSTRIAFIKKHPAGLLKLIQYHKSAWEPEPLADTLRILADPALKKPCSLCLALAH
jgi:hypothetical protein